MVDAIDLGLVEVPLELGVELPGALEIPPKGLLHDQPRPAAVLPLVQASLAQVLHYGGEERGRRRQVEDPVTLRPPLAIQPLQELLQPVVGLGLLRVARHIEDPTRERFPDIVRDLPRALLLQGPAKPLPELFVAHLCPRDTDHRELQRQPPLRGEIVEGGDQLARGQVPRRPEDHHDPRFGHTGKPSLVPGIVLQNLRIGHGWSPAYFSCSVAASLIACPPNSPRRAAMTFMAKESSWREAKRAKREPAMAFAGTSSSMASRTVQRPSPESST